MIHSGVTLEKMRRARQRDVEIGGFTFTVEVPNELRFFQLLEEGKGASELVMSAVMSKECVVGWKGVKESDLLGSASDDELPFNKALWQEWVADRPDFWASISNTLLEARKAIAETREADAKN